MVQPAKAATARDGRRPARALPRAFHRVRSGDGWLNSEQTELEGHEASVLFVLREDRGPGSSVPRAETASR